MRTRYMDIVLVISLILNGFLLCWLFFVKGGHQGATPGVTEGSVQIDTIEIVKERHFEKTLPGKVITKEKIDTLYLRDTLRIAPEDLARRRIYSDTIFQDSARLFYRHSIIGALEHSEYSLFVPERKITEVREKTITEVVERKWQIFGGLQLQQDRISYGGAVYKNGIGLHYYYQPGTKTHRVGLGMRLVSW